MTHLIKVDHLWRYYGKHCAVKDLSFSVDRGEVLGFLGPNGAGKTTTLQIITGNLAPSAGYVSINGFDLLRSPLQAKRSLGSLPDTPPLYKELTVHEFLTYCGQLQGLTPSTIKTAIHTTLERCGLTSVDTRLIANLSKGFQQRVGIAQAILHNPDVIILDEPTVGLDPIQIKEIRALIRDLGQDHGIILSTHILSEVQETCTQVQIIHQGELIFKDNITHLNQTMNQGCLHIKTQRPPNTTELLVLPHVERIETLSPTELNIHYTLPYEPSQRIAETLITQCCGLLEMTPVKKSMEDIFLTLTQEHS